MNVYNEIMEILRQQLNVSAHAVNINSNIFQDLGADSLDAVEIIMHCEEKFNITILEEDAENLYTVGDLVSYIMKQLDLQKAGHLKLRGSRTQITESGEIFEN